MLNSVGQAKADHAAINAATRERAAAIVANPVKAVASGAVMNFVKDLEDRTARIDGHLTDIMMAHDFHGLTGQVVAKVVTLANELEHGLVKLLVSVVPPGSEPSGLRAFGLSGFRAFGHSGPRALGPSGLRAVQVCGG